MEYQNLIASLESSRNPELARRMSAYMRNQFPYLGIPSPKLSDITKPFHEKNKDEEGIDWFFIDLFWEKPEREYQYIALGYLSRKQAYLQCGDLYRLQHLIVKKSWWDTVDSIHSLVGNLALRFPEIDQTLLDWSLNSNIWLRRVAINHQQGRKEKTKTELLERIIVNNLGQKEFFINKAIGWSLRNYSFHDPEWVRDFIHRNGSQMAKLSIKEACKYI